MEPLGTMEPQVPWSHRYHGAIDTMETQVPQSYRYYCNYCYEWTLLSERTEDIL